MMYYKPTLFSSEFLYLLSIFVYKLSMYYKPTLFRADVREIAHVLIILYVKAVGPVDFIPSAPFTSEVATQDVACTYFLSVCKACE